MMEEKIWIYIIIGVIYAIGWIIKKMKPSESPEVEPRQQRRMDLPNTSSAPKQLTFEELLREITEGKTVKETPRPVLKPAYVDYDDDIEDEGRSLEQIPNDYHKKDNIYEVYEEAKKAAFNRPSLEETMKLEDTDVKFGRFKVFEQQEESNLLDEYTREFQDPAGFRRAFVMSEILKPKF